MIDREADGSDSLEVSEKCPLEIIALFQAGFISVLVLNFVGAVDNRASCCFILLPEELALDWAVSSWNE